MTRRDDFEADHSEALGWRRKFREGMLAAIETTKQRDAAEFDGLYGQVPDWLRRDDGRWKQWREARRFFLDKYPEPYIRAWIEERQGYDVPAVPGYDSLPEHRREIEGHLVVLQKVWIEWTTSGRKVAQAGLKKRQEKKSAQEADVGVAVEMLFKDRPEAKSWSPENISGHLKHDLAARKYFPGVSGTPYAQATLEGKVREYLSARTGYVSAEK